MPPSLLSPAHLLSGLALTAAVFAAASGLGGCANASHVVMAQELKLGLTGGVDGTVPGVIHASLGYHRRAAVIIPKVDVSGEMGSTAPGSPLYEAASVASASAATFNGLRAPEVEQLVMTGRAAVLAAAQIHPFPTPNPTTKTTPTPPSKAASSSAPTPTPAPTSAPTPIPPGP